MVSFPHRTGLIRRTLLYGAAFGLLAGLASVAASGASGDEAIALWRNAILIGSALGFAAGLIRAAKERRPSSGASDDGHSDTPREPEST